VLEKGRGITPGTPYGEWQHQREASALYRVGAFFCNTATISEPKRMGSVVCLYPVYTQQNKND